MRLPAWTWLVSVLWLVPSAAGDAVAQQSGGPGGRILFLMPTEVDPDVGALLIDALTAQFAASGTALNLRTSEVATRGLRARVEEAQRLARQDDQLVGVFWLDTASDRSWLLYLTEPEGDRVLVRRVELTSSSEGAAAEAIGLITSRSSEALLEGQTIGMRPVEVPAEPPVLAEEPEPAPPTQTPPAPTPKPESRVSRPPPPPRQWYGLRLRGGYRGTSYAEGIFQSGFAIGAEWMARVGAYAGLGAGFFAPIDVDLPFVGFQVRRTPLELTVGWHWAKKAFSVDTEFAGTLDLVTRSTVRRRATVQGKVSETRTVFVLGPRARAAYTFASGFGFYAGLGVDVAVNNFPFVAELDGERRELLNPRGVRAVVDAGILFWP